MRIMKLLRITSCIVLLLSLVQPVNGIVAEEYAGELITDSKTKVTWYVYPKTLQRFKVDSSTRVTSLVRKLGKGILNADLEKIPQKKTNTNHIALRTKLAGYFYIQVEAHGEAWYVNSTDLKRYSMGDDALAVLQNLSTEVKHNTVKQIHVDKALDPTGATGTATTTSYTINTAVGAFPVIVTKIPRGSYELITDTANTSDCTSNCSAKSLAEYVQVNNAEGGIHGSYFCPPDYSACAGQTNSFLPPMFNSAADRMINSVKLPFHSGPMIVAGKNEQLYYFHRTKDFGYTTEEFEDEAQTLVTAAVANYPALIEHYDVVVHSEYLDSKQRDVKSNRGGIGYSDDYMYLVVARSATVIDLAYIFASLNVEYAINLDGGGSAALYDDGRYYIGPGRALPNAILYRQR